MIPNPAYAHSLNLANPAFIFLPFSQICHWLIKTLGHLLQRVERHLNLFYRLELLHRVICLAP
jgi:hypothetical protein